MERSRRATTGIAAALTVEYRKYELGSQCAMRTRTASTFRWPTSERRVRCGVRNAYSESAHRVSGSEPAPRGATSGPVSEAPVEELAVWSGCACDNQTSVKTAVRSLRAPAASILRLCRPARGLVWMSCAGCPRRGRSLSPEVTRTGRGADPVAVQCAGELLRSNLGPRTKSDLPGYSDVGVTFTAEGKASKPIHFLLSDDGNRTLAQFTKFDISQDPKQLVSAAGRPGRGGPATCTGGDRRVR